MEWRKRLFRRAGVSISRFVAAWAGHLRLSNGHSFLGEICFQIWLSHTFSKIRWIWAQFQIKIARTRKRRSLFTNSIPLREILRLGSVGQWNVPTAVLGSPNSGPEAPVLPRHGQIWWQWAHRNLLCSHCFRCLMANPGSRWTTQLLVDRWGKVALCKIS